MKQIRNNRESNWVIVVSLTAFLSASSGCNNSNQPEVKPKNGDEQTEKLSEVEKFMVTRLNLDEKAVELFESVKTPEDVKRIKPKLLEIMEKKQKLLQQMPDFENMDKEESSRLENKYGKRLKELNLRKSTCTDFFDKQEFQEAIKEIEDLPVF